MWARRERPSAASCEIEDPWGGKGAGVKSRRSPAFSISNSLGGVNANRPIPPSNITAERGVKKIDFHPEGNSVLASLRWPSFARARARFSVARALAHKPMPKAK